MDCSGRHASASFGVGRVNALWQSLLEGFGSGFLDGLRDLAGAGGVADLAGLLVAAGVVDAVGDLLLESLGRSLLDLPGELGVGGVGGALAVLVGAGGGGGRHSEGLGLTGESGWSDGLFDCGSEEGFHCESRKDYEFEA